MNRKLRTIIWFFLSALILLSFSTNVSAEVIFPDIDFGADGQVVLDNPVKNSNPFYPKQIERANGGGYIFASYIKSQTGDYDIVMCKVTSIGGIDTTFGTSDNGCVTYGSSANDYFSTFIQTGSGKYLVVGYSWANGAVDENIYLLMINEDGSLDTAFDGDGILLIGDENDREQLGYTAIEDGSGSFIVVGTTRELPNSHRQAYVTKVNPDGSIDTSFGTGGELIWGSWNDEDLKTIVRDGSGNYLLGGYEGWGGQDRNYYFAKITPGGELVSDFGTNGEVEIDLFDDEYGENMIRLSNGNYLVQGTGEIGSETYSFLLAIDDDGVLVPSFGTGGYLQMSSGIEIGDIDEDSDSRILTVGSKSEGGTTKLILQSYTHNGIPDTSLNNGLSTYTLSNFTNSTHPIYGETIIYDASKNSAIVGGYFQSANGTFDSIIVKFKNGYHITGLPDNITATSEDRDIKIGSDHGIFDPSQLTINVDGYKVFEGEISLDDDKYWGNLNVPLSLNEYKMVFDDSKVDGITDADYIYVPKHISHNFVVICPGATQLSQLSKNCDDAEILHINSSDIEVVNNNGKEFWKIEANITQIGAMSYAEDDSSEPVQITQMHKFTEIPDYHDIEFYTTSKWVYIRGLTEANATVTFLTDSQKFTTVSNDDGEFAIKVDITHGIAHVDVDYYSTSTLGVNSVYKNLTLHIGCETFPNDLYARFCIKTQKKLDLLKDENEETGFQTIEDDKDEELMEDPLLDNQLDTERRRSYERVTTKKILLQFLDLTGAPITSSNILIDGEEFTTSGVGQVEVEIDKEASELLVTYNDGVAQMVTVGNASFIKVRREAELNSLPLLLLVVLVPSVIVSIISVKLVNLIQKRRRS